ncbi:MAG: RNA 2',3'-cyclic phosphodiesterase [Pirellulales bacterium]|nr:RNA 2',3'-cyclic phosphodiesterase [Pirellulales bacterium]
MSKTRTFIAIKATDEVRNCALATIKKLRGLADNIKWVAPENLHWTLQFLGDVGDAQTFEVCRHVAQVAAEVSCFTLHADRVGAFPSTDRPRAIWLGAGEGSEPICRLQGLIEARMSELGFRSKQRRFVPHLTLGRVNKGSHAGTALGHHIAGLEGLEPSAMVAEEVIIFGSELERNGPTYHVLGRALLDD